MNPAVDDIITLCRLFGTWERVRICCGSVTVPQCVVLQGLLLGPTEVAVLARGAGSSPSAMTRLLDGLVGRGWVERRRDEVDRRRVQVLLTPAGKTEALGLRARTVLTLEAVLGNVPEEKQDQVLESLSLIRKAMEQTQVDLQLSVKPR